MIKAAMIVQNCPPGQFSANLKASMKWIATAADMGADMVVFPEMNLTGYTPGESVCNCAAPLDKHLSRELQTAARDRNLLIGVGLAEKGDGKKIHASHAFFFPDGSCQVYRKIHTSPFEKNGYTAGNQVVVFDYKDFRFGIQLCYDAHFPELSKKMALSGADVLLIPHASPRGTSEEKFQSWMRHLQARAFDNGTYVAAWNQTGSHTGGLTFPGLCVVIGPDGNPAYRSIEDREGLHLMEFDRDLLEHVRSHQMRYFLPNRREDLFPS